MAKKLNKKTKKEISRNTLIAIALTSVLINLFFLIGVIIYSSTSKFDKALLVETMARYCDDINDVRSNKAQAELDEAANVDDGVPTEISFNIVCRTGEFAPYYDSAVQDYLRDLGY